MFSLKEIEAFNGGKGKIVKIEQSLYKGGRPDVSYVIHTLTGPKRINISQPLMSLREARIQAGIANYQPPQPPVPKSNTAKALRAEENRRQAHSHMRGGK